MLAGSILSERSYKRHLAGVGGQGVLVFVIIISRCKAAARISTRRRVNTRRSRQSAGRLRTGAVGQDRSLAAILSILVSDVSLRAVRSMPLLGGVERREQLAELGAPCRRPGSLAQKRPLLNPLFQISG